MIIYFHFEKGVFQRVFWAFMIIQKIGQFIVILVFKKFMNILGFVYDQLFMWELLLFLIFKF
jgi:hypothetical protein